MPTRDEWIGLAVGLGLAVALTVGQAAVTLDETADISVWAAGTAFAVVRSVGQYIITRIGQRAVS